MDGEYVIGYWNTRGRGQVIRLLLAYTGVNWSQKIYKEPGDWFAVGDKAKLGLDFPNLPYLIYGDFKLTQSSAITNYIIRKSGKGDLLGKSLEDQAKVEMINSVIDEIFSPTQSLFFSPNYDKESQRLFEGKIKDKLTLLSSFANEKNTMLDYLTLADFKLAEASYYFEKMYVKEFKEFPFLKTIRSTVENLKEVQKYYEGQTAIKSPFLPNYAALKF